MLYITEKGVKSIFVYLKNNWIPCNMQTFELSIWRKERICNAGWVFINKWPNGIRRRTNPWRSNVSFSIAYSSTGLFNFVFHTAFRLFKVYSQWVKNNTYQPLTPMWTLPSRTVNSPSVWPAKEPTTKHSNCVNWLIIYATLIYQTWKPSHSLVCSSNWQTQISP